MEMQVHRLYAYERNGVAVHQDIMLVAEKVGISSNGNPVHLITVFMYHKDTGYGHQWSPKLKGRRQRKDGKYRISGHQKSKLHMLKEFRNELQEFLDNDRE